MRVPVTLYRDAHLLDLEKLVGRHDREGGRVWLIPLVPIADPSRRHEDGCGQSEAIQDRPGRIQDAAITIIERDGYRRSAYLATRIEGVFQRHHSSVAGEELHLLFECLDRNVELVRIVREREVADPVIHDHRRSAHLGTSCHG